MNADGTMARMPQLQEVAHENDLKIISIKDLIAYRLQHEQPTEQTSSTLNSLHSTLSWSAVKQSFANRIR